MQGCGPLNGSGIVVSGNEISAIWQRFKQRLQPRLQGLAAATPGRFDLAARLVDLADATEAGFARLLRPVRRALRSGAIGLTGGLVWRGLAALTGVSLTAMLVAGLSSGSSEPALASLPAVVAETTTGSLLLVGRGPSATDAVVVPACGALSDLLEAVR